MFVTVTCLNQTVVINYTMNNGYGVNDFGMYPFGDPDATSTLDDGFGLDGFGEENFGDPLS